MRPMRLIRPLFLLCAVVPLSAQVDSFKPTKEPVPDALRELVTSRAAKFYGLQMESRYRQAEALVCEDSKDTYYAENKPHYKKTEFRSIDFADGLKEARVMTTVHMEVAINGMFFPVQFGRKTIWREEQGSWCLHIMPPDLSLKTPMGAVLAASGVQAKPAPDGTGHLPLANPGAASALGAGFPGGAPVTVESVTQMVHFSKSEVHFTAGKAATETIEIVNTAPGSVNLVFSAPSSPELDCKLGAGTLAGGARTTLTISYSPKDTGPAPATTNLELKVEPLSQTQKIAVVFAPAAH